MPVKESNVHAEKYLILISISPVVYVHAFHTPATNTADLKGCSSSVANVVADANASVGVSDLLVRTVRWPP